MIKATLVRKIVETESVDNCLEKKGSIYTYLNVVSYLTAMKNKSLFEAMDGIFVDGILLAIAIALLYGKRVHRKSFDMTSMAPELLSYANEKHKSVCIVATHQDKLDFVLEMFSKQYPNIVWKCCRNGYFASQDEQEETAKNITEMDPDFLIVGMGIKMQEKFLLTCKNAGYKGIGFTCGGFIHQTAENKGGLDYYPSWVDRLNLRFFYRMYKEPHTRKRYAIAAFVFPYRFLKERLFG